MPKHECETWDFPIASGQVDAEVAGLIRSDVIKAALKAVRVKAEKAGNAATANDSCVKPCNREIYIEVEPHFPPEFKRKQGSLFVKFTADWKAGILCYRLPEKDKK
jgi:hypothetical protein